MSRKTSRYPRAVLRILDANRHRALEGLRVCEEVLRLHWEYGYGFRQCRRLRHDIAAAVSLLPVRVGDLAEARATDSDVGRRAKGSRVASLEALLLINFQRVKEALRVLEESSRFLGTGPVRRFQGLRFRVYAVERNVLLRLASLRDH